jgi:hypothetical protein
MFKFIEEEKQLANFKLRVYRSVAAGREFCSTNAQKVQYVGASPDLFFLG